MSHQPKIVVVRALALALGLSVAVFAGIPAARATATVTTTTAATPPAAASALTDAQKAEVKTLIRDYLVAHPEVVIEGLNSYQRNQEKHEQDKFKQNLSKYKAVLTSADTPTGGNPNGTKAVVEFFDYNCGYCKRAVSDVTNLIKQDKDVKVYFKDMPILASSSEDAARWALAAAKQGKYFEFHVALMNSAGARDKTTFKKIAAELGLNVDQLEKDADGDKAIREAIEKNLQVARDMGIHGTPSFIIGDQLFPGYMGLEGMKKAVADAFPAAAAPPSAVPAGPAPAAKK